MFPVAGHSVQRIWTRFGVRPPYNLRMVKRRLFCRETARHPSTVGSFRIPHVKVEAAAAAAAISRGHATCGRPPLLWMGVRVGVDPGIPRCRHSGDNSCGVSNDKASTSTVNTIFTRKLHATGNHSDFSLRKRKRKWPETKLISLLNGLLPKV